MSEIADNDNVESSIPQSEIESENTGNNDNVIDEQVLKRKPINFRTEILK